MNSSDNPLHPSLINKLSDCPYKLSNDFKLFIDNLLNSKINIYFKRPLKSHEKNDYYFKTYGAGKDYEKMPRIFLMNDYSIGGVTGGSYMSDDNSGLESYQTDPSEYPNFEDWDKVITTYWPDMSFMTFRAIQGVLLSHRTYTINEYYGNSTTYKADYVDLEKLYVILASNNKLTPQKTITEKQNMQSMLDILDLAPLAQLPEPKKPQNTKKLKIKK